MARKPRVADPLFDNYARLIWLIFFGREQDLSRPRVRRTIQKDGTEISIFDAADNAIATLLTNDSQALIRDKFGLRGGARSPVRMKNEEVANERGVSINAIHSRTQANCAKLSSFWILGEFIIQEE